MLAKSEGGGGKDTKQYPSLQGMSHGCSSKIWFYDRFLKLLLVGSANATCISIRTEKLAFEGGPGGAGVQTCAAKKPAMDWRCVNPDAASVGDCGLRSVSHPGEYHLKMQ